MATKKDTWHIAAIDDATESASRYDPMTIREWIAVVGIVFSLCAAAVGYGQMANQIADAHEEIRLLRDDMRAINRHFIVWVAQHEREDP